MSPQPSLQLSPLNLEPVPTLIRRLRAELAADFDFARPVRISRAPGRLDVIGGIIDYTGGLVCEATLDRAAAVALQPRDDRQLQVFSFNLLDEHQPFTLRIPLEALAANSADALRREFAEPGRKWAGYLAGCLFVLHEKGYINLLDPTVAGLNLALYSTVPLGAGVSSSAAIEVATMMALADHFSLLGNAKSLDPLTLSALCQQVENRIVGAPCGIMDQVTSTAGQENALLKLLCQPHELQGTLCLPPGMRVLGINSNVRHSVGGGHYGKTRCAAFMGHKIILQLMKEFGQRSGKELAGDPMNGYLANLDADDYKSLFRPHLPARIRGLDFLERYGPTIDKATTVHPEMEYHVQAATDHHVLEARRVRQFVQFMEQAHQYAHGTREQGLLMDKAGHLMYASHESYTNNALLGAPECDLLVDLCRRNEKAGLYGAKITGGGSGGSIAVLADASEKSTAALESIMREYEQKTGRKPEAFFGSSPGAWSVRTALLNP